MNRLRRCFYDQLEGLHCPYWKRSHIAAPVPSQEDAPQMFHLFGQALPSAGNGDGLAALLEMGGKGGSC